MAYNRLENETTALWLERLIGLGAPADIRADVRQILSAEQANQGKPPQNSSHHKLSTCCFPCVNMCAVWWLCFGFVLWLSYDWCL